jgi:hypothetical protein
MAECEPVPVVAFKIGCGCAPFRGPVGLASTYAFDEAFETAYQPTSFISPVPSSGNGPSGTPVGTKGASCQTAFAGTCPKVIRRFSAAEWTQYICTLGLKVPCDVPPQGVLVTERAGELNVVVPICIDKKTDNNCLNCYKTIFGTCNPASAFQSCFQYNIQLETGHILPMAVKLTGPCLAAFQYASEQCAIKCNKCLATDTFPFDAETICFK